MRGTNVKLRPLYSSYSSFVYEQIPSSSLSSFGYNNNNSGLYNQSIQHDACGVGFIANLKGFHSHSIVREGIEALEHMNHRGAAGAEANSGDGAGIQVALPHEFFKRVAKDELGLNLGERGTYAVGNIFFDQKNFSASAKNDVKAQFDKTLRQFGLIPLGWRVVPTNNSSLGHTAVRSQPLIEQLFVGRPDNMTEEEFERRLWLTRRIPVLSGGVNSSRVRKNVYVCSLSSRTIVYKGMLLGVQLEFYPDLFEKDFESNFAMVHSRFSTNTFPNWAFCQPFRMLAHNGEINTLSANVFNLRSRSYSGLGSPLFEDRMKLALPILPHDNNFSDSQALDNFVELLFLGSNRSLAHSMMMAVPQAWQGNDRLSMEQRAFLQYNSAIQEPWDGPACLTFTDGRQIGAVLDRNGLRPCRYLVTSDDKLVLASEVGVLPSLDAKHIVQKGRLAPGRMLLLDFEKQQIIDDATIKQEVASALPYGKWIQEETILLKSGKDGKDGKVQMRREDEAALLESFGFTQEYLDYILVPMGSEGHEAMGSMGNDAPVAVLSELPHLLYDYAHQNFSQVTNPALDAVRERTVMSLSSYIGGAELPLLADPKPEAVRRLWMESPLLDPIQMKSVRDRHFALSNMTIDTTFPLDATQLWPSLKQVAVRACEAVSSGRADLLILSDRAAGEGRVAIPPLLVAGYVSTELSRAGLLSKTSLIMETGECFDVHHVTALCSFGAAAVHPYMAYVALDRVCGHVADAYGNYRKAVEDGIYKVLAKVGVCTAQSYRNSGLHELIGLGNEVTSACFPYHSSPLGGITFEQIAMETLQRHANGYKRQILGIGSGLLPNPGELHFRSAVDPLLPSEQHLDTPAAIASLQSAARTRSKTDFATFSKEHDVQVSKTTLRGLLEFVESRSPLPLDAVEPAADIVRRFRSGAMSYGSISEEAHKAIGIGMNRMKAQSNSGEGGEDEARWSQTASGDLASSAIKQVASGRFGVTIEYLTYASEIQIKIAQGAKPGEGGELGGAKVTADIARTRMTMPGVGLISPPPHHDIYSIEDLKQLIWDLKNANPHAKISVKLVSKRGVGVIAAGVVKAQADHITVSGWSGGTGSAKFSSIKHCGAPWETGVAETHQTLIANGLRDLVTIETDGHLRNGTDVVKAAILGADYYGFGTAPLIALGCIMMRQCHTGLCPVGIATQDPRLRKMFKGQPEHVVNYFFLVAEEVRTILARLGFRSLSEVVGKTELLRQVLTGRPKADALDLSPLLVKATPWPGISAVTQRQEDARREMVARLDQQMNLKLRKLLGRALPSFISLPISNLNRTVGASLSNDLVKMHGLHTPTLKEDTVTCAFHGHAGQSFGAFLSHGVVLTLEGDANDGVGKGLSGGLISIRPSPAGAIASAPQNNVIIGNACLYGATSGRLFASGQAGERFAVRCSGAHAVVEGCGDHGCSYMTGGRVVILGSIGENFASGMSGGIAYVWDPTGKEREKIVKEHELSEVGERDSLLHSLVQQHLRWTGSPVAQFILSEWEENVQKFVKVFPKEYQRLLNQDEQDRRANEELVLARLKPKGKLHELGATRQYSTVAGPKKAAPARRRPKEPVEAHEADRVSERPSVVESPRKAEGGFMLYNRDERHKKPVGQRIKNWKEIWLPRDEKAVATQAARCMDCGVPFCHDNTGFGCPLGNKGACSSLS